MTRIVRVLQTVQMVVAGCVNARHIVRLDSRTFVLVVAL